MSYHLIQIMRFGSFREAYQKTHLVVYRIFFYVNQMGKFWLYGMRNDIIPANIAFWGHKAGCWILKKVSGMFLTSVGGLTTAVIAVIGTIVGCNYFVDIQS